MDACGNTSTTSATFTIEDQTARTFSVMPSDLLLECNSTTNITDINNWLASNGGASANETCSTITWSNDYSGLSDLCGETGSAIVVFTATDDCGMVATASADIIISDTTVPVIIISSSDMTVECDDSGNIDDLNTWLAFNGGAMATDGCGTLTWTNNFTSLSDLCGSTGSATVTFTVSDDCGNTATTFATFTIEDTQDPLIVQLINSDLTVECDGTSDPGGQIASWLSNNAGATVSDECGNVSWSNNFSGLTDLCGTTGSATVVFTATDDCGNTSTFDATVTITDNTDPVITNPAVDTIANCDSVLNPSQLTSWLSNNGGAVANDDCGNVTWSNDYSALNSNCAPTVVIFTATDDCGNTSTTSASFTVIDNIDPTIITPAVDLNLSCDTATNATDITNWLNANGNASANDGCSSISWTNDYAGLSDDCGATGSATVTFTVTDACGNTSTTSATVTVSGTTAPTIVTEASDLILECTASSYATDLSNWLSNNGGAIANNDCGVITWTDDFNGLTGGCGNTGTATVIFTASDDCGNTSTTSATITISDNVAPIIFNAAQDITVDCDDPMPMDIASWLNTNGGALASDDCSINLTWSNNFDQLGGICAPSTCVYQNINTEDFESGWGIWNDGGANAQRINNPAFANSGAWSIQLVDNGPSATMTTNSLDLTVYDTMFLQFNFISDNMEIGEDFWLQVSENGGASFTTIGVLVQGVNFVNGINYTASISIPGPFTNDMQFRFRMSATSTNDFLYIDDVILDACTIEANNTVIFTVTDDCGNNATSSANVTYRGGGINEMLLTEEAQDTTIECGDQAAIDAWLANNGGALVSNEQTDLILSNNDAFLDQDESDDSNPNPSELLINGATGAGYRSMIHFNDIDELPAGSIVSSAILNLTVTQCNAQTIDVYRAPNPWTPNGATWQSHRNNFIAPIIGSFLADCGGNTTYQLDITALVNDWINGVYPNHGIFIRARTNANIEVKIAATNFGNSSLVPSIDVTYAAGGGISGGVVWTNDYSGVTAGCGNTGTAIVTFTATDVCDNTVTTTATLTVEDTQAPVLDTPAQNMTVECDGTTDPSGQFAAWLTNNGGATVTELCGNVTWTNNSSGLSDLCGMTGSEMVVFTASDDCGLSVQTTATFTIEDKTAPVFTTLPADLNVSCDGTGNNADISNWLATNGGAVVDEACGAISWANDYTTLDKSCSATVTFTVTDECGLTSTAVASIKINDTEAPQITTRLVT